jgi:hypothetical protein
MVTIASHMAPQPKEAVKQQGKDWERLLASCVPRFVWMNSPCRFAPIDTVLQTRVDPKNRKELPELNLISLCTIKATHLALHNITSIFAIVIAAFRPFNYNIAI